ncbi:hypothetical protein FQA39_LY10407 [Lamprigera yunnana]|nr:hypothetical protein FQA39_LY10407 [Lamprigera yunnana]
MAYGEKDETSLLVSYRELAYFILKREQFDQALFYFDEALSKVPNDKRALLGRSTARSKACAYEGAIDDIRKALELDPENLALIAQKAINIYLCCEFEDALVLNYQMVPKRKKPDNFTMGVMNCTEAIENNIGLRTGHPLRDHYKIIRKIAWNRIKEVEDPYKVTRKRRKKKSVNENTVREAVIPEIRALEARIKSAELGTLCITDSLNSFKPEVNIIPPCVFPYKPKQNYTSNIKNYMAERYLDSMYLDKIFLNTLKDHPGVISPNKEGTKKIQKFGKDGYKLLSYKQELLRTRRPFYLLKHQEAKITGIFKERVQKELCRIQVAAKSDADKILLTIKNAVNSKNTKVALETAEKLKLYCDTQPKKILPNRDEYLHAMYELVGIAYYQLFRINANQKEGDQIKRILNWMKLPLSRQPSTDSIITQFKNQFIDWRKQIQIFEDRLRKATTPDEMCWLYHGLASYSTEIKQYELARVYSRKCIQEGILVQSNYWIMNAMMVLARVSILQHNRNDAKIDLNNALSFAKKIRDNTLIQYIHKCQKIIDVVEYDDHLPQKVIEKREKEVIGLMSGQEMKDEVAFLFRKMDAMLCDRRMSVMPGVVVEDIKKPTPSMKKASILPTGEKTAEGEPPPSGMKKISQSSGNESESKDGVAFMELIKYHID